MKAIQLNRIQRLWQLREQKSANRLKKQHEHYQAAAHDLNSARVALDEIRTVQRQREREIYRDILEKLIEASKLERLRWELIEIELRTDRARAELDRAQARFAAAETELAQAKSIHLGHWRRGRKWSSLVELARFGEETLKGHLEEFERDELQMDRAGRGN